MLQRDTGCLLIWLWHHNVCLHFAAADYTSLSCPVLLIWPVRRVEAVMSIASTPLPMWTDRAPSHTSAHTCVEWFFQCHTHANTHTHYMNSQCARWRLQPHSPGGNDRFKECCGWRWTEAGLGRIFVTCYMQRRRGVMTSSF